LYTSRDADADDADNDGGGVFFSCSFCFPESTELSLANRETSSRTDPPKSLIFARYYITAATVAVNSP